MGEYYDKDQFTGGATQGQEQKQTGWGYGTEYSRGTGAGWGGGAQGQNPAPPPRPPQRSKKEDETWWYSWPAIIILFSLGAWPIALILLFYNMFAAADKQRKKSVSREVERTVERVMRKAAKRVDKAADQTETVLRRTTEEVGQSVTQAAKQVEQAISRAAKDVEQARNLPPLEQEAPAKPEKKQKKAKAEKVKKPRKTAGALMRLIGIGCLALGGIIGLDFIAEVASGYGPDFDNLFASLGFLFGGGLAFFRGLYLGRMSRRSQRYILAIGNTDAMPIDTIAKRVNRKPKQAMKELQKLIDKGYMGEDAYIDYERGYFLRFGATLEEEPEFEPEPEQPPVRVTPPTPAEAEQGYSGILRNIRRANDRIADPALSRKIDRLEHITGMIFKEVEEHPEKRERIHTFFDYYLPTTQKLLDAYADFEETGVEGEHLREAKVRIASIMDSIVDGFAHQLDQLYSSDAMDVVTDIKVMEAMLNRDMATMARDFGIDASRPLEGKHVKKDADDGPRLQL